MENPLVVASRNLVVMPSKIVFYRYGFEQHTRVEESAILLVFPILNSDNRNISSQITSLCASIRAKDKALMELLDLGSTHRTTTMAVAAPIHSTAASLIHGDKNVFKSWVKANIRCPSIATFITQVLAHGYYAGSNDEEISDIDIWIALSMMASNDTFLYSSTFEENAKGRTRTVRLIRMMLAMWGRAYCQELIARVYNHTLLDVDSKLTPYSGLSLIIQNKHALNLLKEKLLKVKDKNRKPVLRSIEDVLTAHNIIRELSTRLEKNHSPIV
jgi:hypothetical protein